MKPKIRAKTEADLTPKEWEKLEKLAAQQIKDKQFTEYEDIKQAREHIRNLFR